MKNFLLGSAVIAAVAAPTATLAQAASPPPLTGNMTIASDYRFRGISQTFAGPAIQGGIDYAHPSGIYLGNWNSNVSGNQYPNGSSIEMDFYGGWKGSWGDLGLDIGAIYYAYPGSKFLPVNVNSIREQETIENAEAYIGASWKWFAAKYYYSFTDYFGLTEDVVNTVVGCNPKEPACIPLARNGDSKGTQYFTGSVTVEIMPKLTVGASAGYTSVRNYRDLNYWDYKVGLTYDASGWQLGAAIVGTDADKKYWYAVNGEGKVREIGKAGLVLSVGKTF